MSNKNRNFTKVKEQNTFFGPVKVDCFWPSMVYANNRNIYSSNDKWENCNTL